MIAGNLGHALFILAMLLQIGRDQKDATAEHFMQPGPLIISKAHFRGRSAAAPTYFIGPTSRTVIEPRVSVSKQTRQTLWTVGLDLVRRGRVVECGVRVKQSPDIPNKRTPESF